MDNSLPQGLAEYWGKFLADGQSLSGLFDHPVLFPLQRRREMEAMHDVAKSINPKVAMEIGTDKGGSAWAWLHSQPTLEKFIACEIRGTPYSNEFEEAFPEIDFLWLPRSSFRPSTVNRVREWLNGVTIDVLFIDGDKCYFDKDYGLYLPYVSKGGIVFMHDVCENPMKEAYEKCSLGKRTEIIKDVSECQGLSENREGEPTGYKAWLEYWMESSCTVGVIYND
jgi:predicted O-methyltransferase YrrM